MALRRSMTISENQSSSMESFKVSEIHEDDNSDHSDDNMPRTLRTYEGGGNTGKTLMDIIREEQETNGAESIRNNEDGTINWKQFKDRIRLRRAGAALSEGSSGSGNETEEDIISEHNPMPHENNISEHNPVPSLEPEPKVQMSLMALLEQTGSYDSEEEGEDEDDEDEEDDDGDDEGGEHSCCVCMVRHKGAAFIPCGHTFCRLCSRELWVSRGNCPLCNGFILEILDIF